MTDVAETITTAENFFTSGVFDSLFKGILIYLAIFWIALVIWVARDVINRTNSLVFQILMIVLNIILPIFGLVVYLVIRPNKTLVEKYYEEIEYRALAEGALAGLNHCPKCGSDIARDFLYCPNCAHELRRKCSKCGKVFDIHFKICPYCATRNTKQKTEEIKPSKKILKTFSLKKF